MCTTRLKFLLGIVVLHKIGSFLIKVIGPVSYKPHSWVRQIWHCHIDWLRRHSSQSNLAATESSEAFPSEHLELMCLLHPPAELPVTFSDDSDADLAYSSCQNKVTGNLTAPNRIQRQAYDRTTLIGWGTTLAVRKQRAASWGSTQAVKGSNCRGKGSTAFPPLVGSSVPSCPPAWQVACSSSG